MNGVEVFIPLTKGYVATIDIEDWNKIRPYSWHAKVTRGRVYAARTDRTGATQKTIRMHREIVESNETQEVDHQDGDSLNNKRYNLRLCTAQQNSCNTRKRANTACQYKGVRWHTSAKKWQAFIQRNAPKQFFHLGLFLTAEEAARAYDAAAKQHFGEFARLNLV